MRRPLTFGLAPLAALVLATPTVLAQETDAFAELLASPFKPDTSGNYRTSQTQGNRGLYEVRHWLVVDRDPEGTNCRSVEDLKPIGRVEFGQLLETDVNRGELSQAVVIREGQAWLRVKKPDWRLPPVAPFDQASPDACLIRANAKFVVPVNVIDLQHVIWKSK